MFGQQQQQQQQQSSRRYFVQFLAGKMYRDGNSKMVKPDNRKGMVCMEVSDDSLLHFIWKDRKTNLVEDDLIIFPAEAEFEKVTEANPKDRVYVLKFESSSQKHFFWMQDPHDTKDEENIKKVNQAINDPSSMVSESSSANPSQNDQLAQLFQQFGNNNQTDNAPATSSVSPSSGNPLQLNQLRDILSNIEGQGTDVNNQDLNLSSVLTVENLRPILQNATSRNALFPHLPEGAPHTQSELEDTINSPQFKQAMQTLTYALRSGSLQSVLSQLGLPASTQPDADGVRALLNAIANHSKNNDHDQDDDHTMDTS